MEYIDKLKANFGEEWVKYLEDTLTGKEFKDIIAFIKERKKYTEVYPKSEDVFNAFSLTSLNTVRVVILGQD